MIDIDCSNQIEVVSFGSSQLKQLETQTSLLAMAQLWSVLEWKDSVLVGAYSMWSSKGLAEAYKDAESCVGLCTGAPRPCGTDAAGRGERRGPDGAGAVALPPPAGVLPQPPQRRGGGPSQIPSNRFDINSMFVSIDTPGARLRRHSVK